MSELDDFICSFNKHWLKLTMGKKYASKAEKETIFAL